MRPLDPAKIALTGTHLIEASAGTGKTYTLGSLFLRLLTEADLPVSDILIVTFTRAATADLRRSLRARIRAQLADEAGPRRERLLRALRSFGDTQIFTIHAFCQRVLSEHALSAGEPFEVELLTDPSDLIEQLVTDFWTRAFSEGSELWVTYATKQLRHDELTNLIARVARSPSVRTVPAWSPEPSTASLEARWRRTLGELRTLWQRERAAVIDLLCSPRLNQRQYKADLVRTQWPAKIDALIDSAGPPLNGLLERLTATKVVEGTKKGATAPRHRFFDLCQDLFDLDSELAAAFRTRLTNFKHEAIRDVREKLRQHREAWSVRTYDDFVFQLERALLEEGSGDTLRDEIRTRYKAVLIDEFQDTDSEQYAIFRKLFVGRREPLFLIGDPKQAIYAFRGADVYAYLRAASDASESATNASLDVTNEANPTRHTLETNWRSDPSLVEAVNHLFLRLDHPFELPGVEFRRAQARPGASEQVEGLDWAALRVGCLPPVHSHDTETSAHPSRPEPIAHAARYTAQVAVDLLFSGARLQARPIEPRDIAILCRTNRECAQVQETLRLRGLNASVETDQTVVETSEAEDLEVILHAASNPWHSGGVRAALSTSLFGLDTHDIANLQLAGSEWNLWRQRFIEWHAQLESGRFLPGFRTFLDEAGLLPQLLALSGGERRVTNLLHLGELLHEAAEENHLGPLGLARWLSGMRRNPAARAAWVGERGRLRADSDRGAIKISTIHKSKGLQYPIVLCPFLWADTPPRQTKRNAFHFHEPTPPHRLVIDVGAHGEEREKHLRLARQESASEAMRLLYVALTRAEHRCVVLWLDSPNASKSPLGKLLNGQHPASDATVATELKALTAETEGRIEGVDLTLTDTQWHPPKRHAPEELHARPATRRTFHAAKTSSFSALVRGTELYQEMPDEAPPAPSEPGALPRGPQVGLLIHELLEEIDFQSVRREDIEARAHTLLPNYGLGDLSIQALWDVVERTVEAPLPIQGGIRLRDIPPSQHRSEVEFVFPVGDSKTFAELWSAARFAHAFDRFPLRRAPDYSRSLRELPSPAFSGFVHGYIDLVFEHAGRWYVVDYKSNDLGPNPQAYDEPTMLAEMLRHHYFVQYHVYTEAVRRHLATRDPHFNYERDFGGVLYLFVRGLDLTNSDQGIFFDRPPQERLQAIFGVGS